MSERKVLTKYYPPEFDPSKITRTPRHLRPTGPKLITVRHKAPFSKKCNPCGEYIYKGKKFNARKETTEEKYLNIVIYRFYIRCTRCSGEITFKTDPKNMDYTCEKGAKRNFEPWRDANGTEMNETDEERLDRLEREAVADEEKVEDCNAMAELEQKMEDSKREMQIADALDEIRTRNARIERGERGPKEEEALAAVRDLATEERLLAESEIEEAARRAFTVNNIQRAREEEVSIDAGRKLDGLLDVTDRTTMPTPPSTFERTKRQRKTLVPGLIKKSEPGKGIAASGLGLDDYDSDSV